MSDPISELITTLTARITEVGTVGKTAMLIAGGLALAAVIIKFIRRAKG
jgi:hypothetical protein